MAKKGMAFVVVNDKVVISYSNAKACDTDLDSGEFLKSHPELEGETLQVLVLKRELECVNPKIAKALELLETGGFSAEEAKRLLCLEEPEVVTEPTANKLPEIPDGWEDAKIGALRKYAKIACPDLKTGRWSKDACVLKINEYLQAQREAHAAALLPVPEDEAPPEIPPPPPATPPPAGAIGAPPPVPAPGTAPPAVTPPALPQTRPRTSGAIPAPPPPPPID
jgi:hypothetical protein